MQDKEPKNNKGQRHGLWEWYHSNGNLYYKCNYVNDEAHGLWKSYYTNGTLWLKGSYVNGKRNGIWEIYYQNGKLKEIRFYAR